MPPPAIITIQLGQCGNQVGFELLQSIYRHGKSRGDSLTIPPLLTPFFRLSDSGTECFARALAIDTEPKVIANIAQICLKLPWTYSRDNTLSLKAGSANNWAFGYYRHGKMVFDKVHRSIRREMEQCGDNFGGFLIISSLAGGTGSGVGAYFTERLRKEYPESLIVNQVVFPFVSGEVIIQNYNVVLSLARIYNASNAIICLENDQLERICAEKLKISSASFSDLNKVIATMLLPIFMPGKCLDDKDSISARNPISELVSKLCANPRFKLLTIKYTPIVKNIFIGD